MQQQQVQFVVSCNWAGNWNTQRAVYLSLAHTLSLSSPFKLPLSASQLHCVTSFSSLTMSKIHFTATGGVTRFTDPIVGMMRHCHLPGDQARLGRSSQPDRQPDSRGSCKCCPNGQQQTEKEQEQRSRQWCLCCCRLIAAVGKKKRLSGEFWLWITIHVLSR